MKPKYYSCFFLSLFACDQGKIEVNNEKAQDVDPKGNLLNVDSSIIDVVNNLCEGVKDINDKNNSPAYVELTTKLVEEYANSFWSLGRCQGIVKQRCEQVPSQIVYDVLYALLKNKCLGAADVRTIIQGIKADNPKVFSLLNNYVEKKFKTCNQGTDDSARIIAESFGFIFNDTIFIPGINIFTSTPLPSPETKITVDRLTNIWHCVNFINSNGFDKTSLQQLINLASSGDFNEAIKTIATSKIIFNGDGDEMMEVFQEKKVNLDNEGLKALAACIRAEQSIATTQNVKYLIQSLNNCTDLAPIFNKCTNDVTFVDFITLLDLIDLNRSTLLDPLAKSLKNETFNLECLQQLIAKYNESDTFNKVLSKISQDKFTKNEKGDKVIQVFDGTKIKLEEDNLNKVLSMISDAEQISHCQKAIDFCDKHIKCNKPNIENVFNKVSENFRYKYLSKLLSNNLDALNQILPYIPDAKLSTNSNGNEIIQKIKPYIDRLNVNTIHTVLSMISNKDNNKISEKNNTKIVQWCCENKGLDITKFISHCKNFQFGVKCLGLYDSNYHNQFFAVLDKIDLPNFHKHSGNTILETIQYLIQNKGMYFEEGNLKKILNLCNKQITNVNALYPVFCRSRKDQKGVKALINLVKDNSLNGNAFIQEIDDNAEKADAQKAFVETFYSKIKDSTITISAENAEKFVWFAYIWYGQDNNLEDLKNKIKKKKGKIIGDDFIKNALTENTLQKFGGKEINDEEFNAFETKLKDVLNPSKKG